MVNFLRRDHSILYCLFDIFEIPSDTSAAMSTGNSPSTEGQMEPIEFMSYKERIERWCLKIKRLGVEQDISGLQTGLTELKRLYEACEDTYYQLVDTAVPGSDMSAINKQYGDIRKQYLETVKGAKKIVKDNGLPTVESLSQGIEANSASSASINTIGSELANALTLPKVSVPHFSGNPVEYATFVRLFEEVIASKVTCDRTKLTYLCTLLRGEALQAVKPMLVSFKSDSYERARDILYERYGESFLVTQSLLKSLSSGAKISGAIGLRQLADEISEASAVMDEISADADSQSFLSEVIKRCPAYVQRKWSDFAMDIRENTGRYPGFIQLEMFMRRIERRASDPVYGNTNDLRNSNRSGVVNAIGTPSHGSHDRNSMSCPACDGQHTLTSCTNFKSMTVPDRKDLVRRFRLCFRCLSYGHFSGSCGVTSACDHNGCPGRHHALLHVDRQYRRPFIARATQDGVQHRPVQERDAVTSVTSDAVRLNACKDSTSARVCLPIIPLLVHGVKVRALLDTGSTSSLVSRSLMKRLGILGETCSVELETVHGMKEIRTQSIAVSVSPLSSHEVFKLEGLLVVDKIPAETSHERNDVKDFLYLEGLSLPRCSEGGPVDILIGMDHPELLRPLEVRGPEDGSRSPYATRTALGWTIQGIIADNSTRKAFVHCVQACKLEEDIERIWNIEKNGDDNVAPSVQDQQVIDLWEKEFKFEDSHYTIPVPWKAGCPDFPNNRFMAEKRLVGTLKKIERHGQMNEYHEGITEMISKGYAELVPPDASSPDVKGVWYLPHHAVIHPVKKKLRIVFDCAASQGGTSLNGSCLSGPDLTTKLLNVLLRFRKYDVAVTADVKAMYMQVKLPVSDRDSLRFLWKEPGQNSMLEYRMCSHVFGGIWCAASSTFALRQCLQRSPGATLAREAVLSAMYVDDLLISKPTVQEARLVAEETRSVLELGGFRLTKFSSSHPVVLSGIPDDDVQGKDKVISDSSLEKVLGLRWDVQSDSIRYAGVPFVLTDVTRRSILSDVASLYDPLGLVAPIVLGGKLLFQEATRRKLAWDDRVPEDLKVKWCSWAKSLRDLSDLVFPRCLVPAAFLEGSAQLHHFGDGSSTAYGAVSYLRVEAPDGRVKVTLVMAKGRVAPMKATTIPRLEIAASVLAVELDVVLRRELKLDLLPSVFWSDSKVALAYIASESRRFKVFVANRVAFIRRHTSVDQWKYIPTAKNPADIISRGTLPSLLPDMWFSGPEFLLHDVSEWPAQSADIGLHQPDVECRKSTTLATVRPAVSSFWGKMFQHYSSLHRLCKAVAWLKGFVIWICSKRRAELTPITALDLKYAERITVMHVQREMFSEDISRLERGRPIKPTSPLRELDPVLVNGVLCVGGRLARSSLSESSKHPVLLPYRHPFSELVLWHYHNKGHFGVEWTASVIRSVYWIFKVRAALKAIRKKCVTCRKLYAPVAIQKMSDLPPERCTPSGRSFSSIGVDLFGPFFVKQGRSVLKRYGCLFTCTRTRAIHLEVLPSLESDSFLNGLVRFSSRRGVPEEVRSDNGTNFVGAVAELKKEYARLDKSQLVAGARKKGIIWSFNPPHAPHFGGFWERLIRTVRRVLCAILNPSLVTSDDVLSTVMCEVECMVNSRPLTPFSDDVNDLTPLTPNHFLMASDAYEWPWASADSSVNAKRRWRQVQAVMHMLWSRWIKEYVPLLQSRCKWNQQSPSLKVGDMVLVSGEVTPRGSWPLGRVLETFPSPDGLVRSVKVKTRLGTFVRPIARVVTLELNV